MAIITAALGGSVTTVFVKNYLEGKNKKHQFVLNIHKQLFDKEAESLGKLNNAYSDLYSVFGENYALTTYEIAPNYIKFKEAIQGFDDYLAELGRYGSSGQVEAAKNLREWWWRVYAEFDLQYKSAELLQSRARKLLLINNHQSDHFKFVNEAFDADLEQLIQNENRIYYAIGNYKKPVIDSMEQYLNYQFRQAIGLDATKEMAKQINELPQLIRNDISFKWAAKQLPFMFAEHRAIYAVTLTFKPEDDLFKRKNDLLKNDAKLKFIASVTEHDEEVKSILKKRRAMAAQK